MDNAAHVCGNIPTAGYIFHQTGHDNGEKHRQQLQDPAGNTSKRNHILHNTSHAIIRHRFDPNHADHHPKRKRYQRNAENGRRDVSFHHSNGDRRSSGNKEATIEQANGKASKHFLVVASIHFVRDFRHFYSGGDARVLL